MSVQFRCCCKNRLSDEMQAKGKQQWLRTDWKVEEKVNADYSGCIWRESDDRERQYLVQLKICIPYAQKFHSYICTLGDRHRKVHGKRCYLNIHHRENEVVTLTCSYAVRSYGSENK